MIEPVMFRIVIKQVALEEYDETYQRAKAIPGFQVVQDEDNKRRAQRGLDEGTVVAIGPTAFQEYGIECPISIGDKVTFARGAAKVVTDPESNEDFAIINDEDVVAILQHAA